MLVNGEIYACHHGKCRTKIRPANSATNFRSPAPSVKLVVDRGLIRKGQLILEIGGGNLRNCLYVLKSVPGTVPFSYDLQHCINRFASNYKKYYALGGRILPPDYSKIKFDIIICTYVLETICPSRARIQILKAINDALKKEGFLVASFRGHSGVFGTKYKKYPLGEGLISPLNTFVKPFSLSDCVELLRASKFKHIIFLENYRVEKPQNIHILAQRG